MAVGRAHGSQNLLPMGSNAFPVHGSEDPMLQGLQKMESKSGYGRGNGDADGAGSVCLGKLGGAYMQ